MEVETVWTRPVIRVVEQRSLREPPGLEGVDGLFDQYPDLAWDRLAAC